jgi:hypothetical protein
MKKTKSIKQTRTARFTWSVPAEQLAWETGTYKSYRWRLTRGGSVVIKPNIDESSGNTYDFAYLILNYTDGSVSFELEKEAHDLHIPDTELELIKEYLANESSIRTRTQVYTGEWNVIDTRQLNRDRKIDLLLQA